jgi:oligopeptide/dipeptide ABC transporter ATP-binding protein
VATVLSVQNLVTEFRMRNSTLTAVDGVSFEINAGECVGLVGESGCGKSTTGLSIMRLLPANGAVSSGHIELLGSDLASLSESEMQKVRGNDVALIPQDPMTSLNPTMRIGKQIAEGVRLHQRVSKQQARQRALEVLRLVEMPRPEERLDQYPHELSGGLRQRVMIAMALVCEPKLLIADEPTTALDVTIQAQILDLIDSLREQLDMAVLLITHDMGVIAGRTDRVVVMYAGKVAEEATTERLFLSTRHPYSAALLASVPTIEERGESRLLSIPGLPPDLAEEIIGCRFAARCQFADATCRASEPMMSQEPGSVHRYACFHPVDGVSSVFVRSAPSGRSEGALNEVSKGETLLRVAHLVKEFPIFSGGVLRKNTGSVKAVSDISFEVARGETFGLVGESGCGKTTVAKLLTLLETPTSGSITFEGTDLLSLGSSELRRQRKDIQLMFQDPYASLDPRMRVGSILREPLKVQRIGSDAEQRARVLSLLDDVGLSPSAVQRYPHEFSGGQRQRIGFARALALGPRLLIADEPVSALDVSIQAQLLNLMKDQQAARGLTMILVSHDLAVMRYMADTIGVMYLGKLVEVGPAATILEHPAHPYSQGLLDAVPVPDVAESRRRRGLQIQGELPSPIDPPQGCRFSTRCPRAQAICSIEEPAFQEFAGGNRAACHFPLLTPLRQSPVAPNAPH